MALEIDTVTFGLIVRTAEKEAPREMCGILVAADLPGSMVSTAMGEPRSKVRLLIAENESERDDEYMIDAGTHMKALDLGEIIGIVHSHVSRDAKMSGRDIANGVVGLVYAIVSLRDRELLCWRLDENRNVISVQLRIV